MPESFSGLYLAESGANGGTHPNELRLDVDGLFPQMAASGTLGGSNGQTRSWMARVLPRGSNTWGGPIRFKRRLIHHTRVVVSALPANGTGSPRMQVSFLGRSVAPKTLIYQFASPFFHDVDFEFDHTGDVEPTLGFETEAHPVRPRTLAREHLTIGQVFERAGFRVTRSPNGLVPIEAAGGDLRWSLQELNDAMEAFREHRDQNPQWRLWVFTTGQYRGEHDEDSLKVEGVMFDFHGRLQRQGAAIFNKSFLSTPPRRDREPDAWMHRMRFWATCHEMGHAFNLAHSWEKSRGNPWLPQRNDRQARSFMNYPDAVDGGQSAFFRTFAFRFTDPELLFLRHAPAEFVQMGNAAWLEGHALEKLTPKRPSGLTLHLRVNRESPTFSYLEPITLEVKLRNGSRRPVFVDSARLRSFDSTVITVQKEGGPLRRFRPFARHRYAADIVKLQPGESLYAAAFVSAGTTGWLLKDPGSYRLRALLRLPTEDLDSNTLKLSIRPGTAAERQLEGDFFTPEVGRVLACDGSRVLAGANATLMRVADRLSGNPVAIHAKVALACAFATRSKRLAFDDTGIKMVVEPADESAIQRLREVLLNESERALETLGHIDYKLYVDFVTTCLEQYADRDGTPGSQNRELARQCQQQLYETMSARRVHKRRIKQTVLDSIKKRLESSTEYRPSRS